MLPANRSAQAVIDRQGKRDRAGARQRVHANQCRRQPAGDPSGGFADTQWRYGTEQRLWGHPCIFHYASPRYDLLRKRSPRASSSCSFLVCGTNPREGAPILAQETSDNLSTAMVRPLRFSLSAAPSLSIV